MSRAPVSEVEVPIRAKSLVVDVYGSYARYRGGALGLHHLLHFGALMGISDHAMRMAVSRLKQQGWLVSERVSRRANYSITPRAIRLLDEGRRRIFYRSDAPWNGEWFMVIYNVPEASRNDRERLRKILSWLGFGSLAPSVWISVNDRFIDLQEVLQEESHPANIDMLRVRSEGADRDREFAERCWALADIAERYTEFLDRYAECDGRSLSDEEAFVRRALLVDDYRRFVHIDPDLPPALLPHDWPGRAAHDRFLELDRLLEAPSNAYFDSVFSRQEPLRGEAKPSRIVTPARRGRDAA